MLRVDPGVELLQGRDVFGVGDPALKKKVYFFFFFFGGGALKGENYFFLTLFFSRGERCSLFILPPSRPPPSRPWPP